MHLTRAAAIAIAALSLATLAACGDTTGSGTRGDPFKYKTKGSSCTSVGGFALTKPKDDGPSTLLLCGTDTGAGQKLPHWNKYNG